jgi:DNA-binding beta-propeller fold protein YncE
MIVTDTGRGTVFVLDPDGKQFLQLGGDQRQVRMRIPISVAVDAEDNIYVGDNGQGAIFVFGPDLVFRTMLTAPGQVESPTGIAIDTDRGRLYAVDTRQHALLAFDLTSGTLVQQIGGKGDQPGEFGWPSGVAVGPDGKVYVSDTMNYRVQVFDPDLEFIHAFGALGVNPGEFRRTKGIAVDAEGLIYVVDSDFNNFQIFDTEGLPLLFVGSYGRRPGQMIMPTGIAIQRATRRIYVTEQVTQRIQVFERTELGAGGN